MSTQFAPDTITNMSIYIPHVFANFTPEYIADFFEKMLIGSVSHVDLVSKMDRNEQPYNAAYIHFNHWYPGTANTNLQAKIRDPTQEARVIHDDPWFWILLENKGKKHIPGERKQTINLDPAPGLPDIEEEEQDPYYIYLEHENSRMAAENEMLQANIDALNDQIRSSIEELAGGTVCKSLFNAIIGANDLEMAKNLACLIVHQVDYEEYLATGLDS
jgi:hypothetical protein